MRSVLAAGVVGLVLSAGCTTLNPNYVGGSGGELGPLPDLAARDLSGDLSGSMLDFATSCGNPGQPCCGGNACKAGCCGPQGMCVGVGDNCSMNQLCTANGCEGCGDRGEVCCAPERCDGDATCNTNTKKCVGCGGPDEPCCPGGGCEAGGCCVGTTCVASGRACGSSLVCTDGNCDACGDAGDACCEGSTCDSDGCCTTNKVCVESGTGTCGGMGNPTCSMGSCGGCGGLGEACCDQAFPKPRLCSASGTVCTGLLAGMCQACGGAGEPCCDNNACASGGCCVAGQCVADGNSCSVTLGTCTQGSCGACGALGQSCCGLAGVMLSFCTEPDTRCISPQAGCQACGGKNQRCCWNYQARAPRDCAPPFEPDIQMGVCYCE